MDQAETYRSDFSSISDTNLNRRSARDQGTGPFKRKQTIANIMKATSTEQALSIMLHKEYLSLTANYGDTYDERGRLERWERKFDPIPEIEATKCWQPSKPIP